MTIHSPIYHKDKPFRVACRSNGLWAVQQRTSDKGTRTVDPWLSIGRLTTLPVAKQRMEAIAKVQHGI